MFTYAPIVKLKRNDVRAVALVSRSSAAFLRPTFEMLRLKEDSDPRVHLYKATETLRRLYPRGPAAADFSLFRPGTRIDGKPAAVYAYEILQGRGRPVVPVYSFAADEGVWSSLPEIVAKQRLGFSFRLLRDDIFESATDTLKKLKMRATQLGIERSNTDILLDLEHLADVDADRAALAIAAFLRSLGKASEYRSITVAGSSLLKFVSNGELPEHGEVAIDRKELQIWKQVSRLIGWNYPLVFADYGVVHPDYMEDIANEHINGKIRYTAGKHVHYFRGCSRKTEPLKEQYPKIARRVMESPVYRGAAFSRGDGMLNECASGLRNFPAPANWILIDMNHHVTYVSKQIGNFRTLLDKKVPAAVFEASLEEI